ncbi:MAG: alanine--tRNA ligase [Puniceicoccales bacterium]|jgi:alanyl-tRNA synthetase|nr:alanine--tRNA ligase [Puniceicoccales bacterium]
MNSDEIRQSFLNFFSGYGHKIMPSSSLLPDTPNLLFTNAGMNQFVPIFLGNVKPPFARVANTQKCIRAGGKHNDLDDVGFDTYHHTFFEMLGNWSFGDFFKREAIEMAWELLTKVWKFPKDRLYATIYSPAPGEPAAFDAEAYGIWEEIFGKEGMSPENRIIPGTKKDNFWMMGESGPCGPCTEIHMDLTPRGDTSGSLVNAGNSWCIELWNLVFIQFNATARGELENLQNKYVDTGMGLERAVGILAKTKNFSDFSQLPSNYDSDLFADIFLEIEKMCGAKYRGMVPQSRSGMSECELTDFWFRAIADHIRALTFAAGDGIFPSNEGRGYVLRRILRRAVMFGNLLHLPNGSFSRLSPVVIGKMGEIFPELLERKSTIEEVLRSEENSFSKTIDRGVSIFREICDKSKGEISGDDAFLLHDTYGFPLDLTQLMATERGIAVDINGFEIAMGKQRTLARAAQKKSVIEIANDSASATEFVGYDIENIENISAQIVDVVSSERRTFLIFSKTPFFAECGGQVGDRGTVRIGENIFSVVDVQKDKNGCHLHEIKNLTGEKLAGQTAILSVDRNVRRNVARNHSATHLLDAALRKVFGNHVKQAGSHVDDRRLRFDFSALTAPTEQELEEVEKLVTEKILACISSDIFEVSADNIPQGCVANFGEKYGKIVRVVKFGDFSMELCGGCHVANTSEITCFKIVSCSAIASNTRRIEAISGEAAMDLFRVNCGIVARQCKDLSCKPAEITERMSAMISRCRDLEMAAKAARKTVIQRMAAEIAQTANKLESEPIFLEKNINAVDSEELRSLALDVLGRLGNAVVTLTTEGNGKCFVVACCSQLAVAAGHSAGNIVRGITSKHGGSGGGRPELAMGSYAISR